MRPGHHVSNLANPLGDAFPLAHQHRRGSSNTPEIATLWYIVGITLSPHRLDTHTDPTNMTKKNYRPDDLEKGATASYPSENDARFDSLEDDDTSALLPVGPVTNISPPHSPLRLRRPFISSNALGQWSKPTITLIVVLFLGTCVLMLFRGSAPISSPDRDLWLARAGEVRDAFTHAYDDYKLLAYPHDELRPLSNTTVDQ